MNTSILLTHERVDDIAMIIGLQQHLDLPAILDRHLGNHGQQAGLSNGTATMLWLAYILSQGDHRKSPVQAWAHGRQHLLARLVGEPLRPVELNDDRLGRVLRRLSSDTAWEGIEQDSWGATVAVYALELNGVRLDSSTAAGYHQAQEGGIMQRGHSKDHRPDLCQLKLMAAAADPSGYPIATMEHPGHAADDPLYTPIIERTRRVVQRAGLLYVGDCKMAAMDTRCDLVAHDEYYLLPLPRNGQPAGQQDAWIEAAVSGQEPAWQLVWDTQTDPAAAHLLGGGYEFSRQFARSAAAGAEPVRWTERVLVFRSLAQARKETEGLLARMAKAEAALWKLTPTPGRGRRQYRDEDRLRLAVQQVLTRYQVTGLLTVAWAREETSIRRGVQVRYVVTGVTRDLTALTAATDRLGWRVYVTNLPKVRMDFGTAIVTYRGGWRLERDFHLVKALPLGISPLFVRTQDQIIGLTRLLVLALRLLILIESQVRKGLAQAGETLSGLIPGQPTHTTARPTATRVLQAFARAEITLTRLVLGDDESWHITPLTEQLARILGYLGLSPSLYARLAHNTS